MQDFTEDISKYVRARTGRDIGSDFDPSLLELLPNIMREFCPGAMVCQNNMSSVATESNFGPGTESCCVGK